MNPTHVEAPPAQAAPKRKPVWIPGIVKVLVPILIASLVLPPVVGYQVKKWPWQRLADHVLESAPGAQRLKLKIFPVRMIDAPGFSFDYETRFESGPTHYHLNQRLASLGFKREADSWRGSDTRHAYFHSSEREIACNIYWRSRETACVPAYGRRDCDPSVNVVHGHCMSTGRESESAYEKIAVAIYIYAVFEFVMAINLVERWLASKDQPRQVQ